MGRWGRAVRWGVLASVGLQGLYLAAANAALGLDLIPFAVLPATHQQLHLSWEHAWSPWYGRVYLTGFKLQFDDSNQVQLDLTVDHATVDVALLSLLRKRVALDKVRATGVSYRMVTKVSAADANAMPRRLAAFPQVKVTGFTPVRRPGPHPRRSQEQIDKLWSVSLDDTRGELREVWFDEYRYVGPGWVRGGFAFEPLKSIVVEPSQLRFDGGSLTAGPHTVAEHFVANLDVEITPANHLDREPRNVLRALSGRMRSDLKLHSLGAVALYRDDLTVAGGGTADIDVRLLQGRITNTSRVTLRLDDLDAHAKDFGFKGRALLEADVHDAKALAVSANVAGAVTSPPVDGTPLVVELRDATGTLAMSSRDLGAPMHFVELSANVPDAKAADASPLTRRASKSLPVIPKLVLGNGPLVGSASLTVTPGAALVRLEQARLGNAVLQGAALRRDGAWTGAAAGKAAGVPVGVRLNDGQPSVETLVPGDWLSSELQRVGIQTPPLAPTQPNGT